VPSERTESPWFGIAGRGPTETFPAVAGLGGGDFLQPFRSTLRKFFGGEGGVSPRKDRVLLGRFARNIAR